MHALLRRFVTVFVAAMMAVSLIPAPALAEEVNELAPEAAEEQAAVDEPAEPVGQPEDETPEIVNAPQVEDPAATAVARVGETEYATLEEAIAAVGNYEPVILLADLTFDEPFVIDKGVYISLNGHTITGPDDGVVFDVSPNAHLGLGFYNSVDGVTTTGTVRGGCPVRVASGAWVSTNDDVLIESTNSSYAAVWCEGGTADLGRGTLKGDTALYLGVGSRVDMWYSDEMVVSGVSYGIRGEGIGAYTRLFGGVVEATGLGGKAIALDGAGVTMAIERCTVRATGEGGYAIWDETEANSPGVNVAGGTFVGGVYASNSTGFVTGGTFQNADGTANMLDASYIADGYTQGAVTGAVVAGNSHEVPVEGDEATVTHLGHVLYYATLEDAFAAVNAIPEPSDYDDSDYDSNDPENIYAITLISDATVEESLEIGYPDMRLDMNGHAVTGPATDPTFHMNRSYYPFWINDSVGGGRVAGGCPVRIEYLSWFYLDGDVTLECTDPAQAAIWGNGTACDIFVDGATLIGDTAIYEAKSGDVSLSNCTVRGVSAGVAFAHGPYLTLENVDMEVTGDGAKAIDVSDDELGRYATVTLGEGTSVRATGEGAYALWGRGSDVAGVKILGGTYVGDVRLPEQANFVYGGTFTNADGTPNMIDAAYIAHGHYQETDTGTVTAGVVAVVGEGANERGFSSLHEAVAAAQPGETVHVMADCLVSEPIVIDKQVTLDVGDCTVRPTYQPGADRGFIVVTPEGDLTVGATTGSIDAYSGDYAHEGNVRAFTVAGKLTVNGGYIHAGRSPIYLEDGGELVINGGEVETYGSAVECFAWSDSESTARIEVNGGRIWGDASAIKVNSGGAEILVTGGSVEGGYGGAITTGHDADLTITGGSISSTGSSAVTMYYGGTLDISGNPELTGRYSVISLSSQNPVEIEVSGGTFTSGSIFGGGSGAVAREGFVSGGTFLKADGTANMLDEAYIAEAHEQLSDTGEVVATHVAKVTHGDTVTYFGTLDEAFMAVRSGDTLTLLDDIELDATHVIDGPAKLTLDFNGHTISLDESVLNDETLLSGTHSLVDVYRCDLTITDTSLRASGGIDASIVGERLNYCLGILGESTVTLAAGTVKGGYNGILVGRQTSELVMTGGEVIGAQQGIEVSDANASIEGGRVYGPMFGLSSHDSTLSISGDAVIEGEGIFGLDVSDKGSALITGGTISSAGMGLFVSGDVDVTVLDGTIEGGEIGIGHDGANDLDGIHPRVVVSGDAVVVGNTEFPDAGAIYTTDDVVDLQGGFVGDKKPATWDALAEGMTLRPSEEKPGLFEVVSQDGIPMFRLYNRWSYEHFYTGDPSERDDLVAAGWTDEGIGWYAPATGDPVYRLYNKWAPGGDHHYTMDVEEYEYLCSVGWTGEGIGWYSDPNQTVPVYREYNPYEQAHNHNYTPDRAEHDNLVSLGWHDEGIGWYGI